MSVRTCHAPVRAAVGDRLTPEQIDGLIETVMADVDMVGVERNVARRLAGMKRELSPAQIRAIVAQKTREGLKEGMLQRRVKAHAKMARELRDSVIASMPDKVHGQAFDAADKLRAYNTGSDKLGFNLGLSVEAESKGRFSQLMTPLADAIEKSGAQGLLNPMFDKAGHEAFENKVAIEIARLNGAAHAATGDKMAEAVAHAFATAQELGRVMQNEVGAWIERRPGYIAKQNHDALKVAGGFWKMGAEAREAAFKAWHDHIRPLLDEETFKDIEHYDIDERILARNGGDVRAGFLETIWSNIVNSSRVGDVGSDFEYEFKTPPSKARAVSTGRTLHFRSPDAWLSYHRAYGQGSLYSVIAQQLEGAARNSALMHRWGPNPEAAFDAHVKRGIEDARAGLGPGGVGVENKLKGQGAESLKGNLLNEWDILTGKAGAPADLRIAAVGNVIRLDQRLAKLGGAVLASLGPDQAIAAHVFRQHGGRFLEGYQGAFGGVLRMNREVQQEIGVMLGVGARHAAQEMSSRFDAGDGLTGMGASLTNSLFKITGFEGVMTGHRRGLAAMWSMHAARQAEKTFSEIEPAFKAQLERFGVTAKDWERLRGNVTEMGDGNRYLHFDGIGGDLGVRMRSYLTQFLDDSLTEPGIREQAKLTFGTKRGDVLGEAVRCFTQFKAFPTTYITRHMAPAIDRLRAGDPDAIMTVAHLIVASTVFGYVSVQAKQLAKGLTPRPLVDEDGNWRSDIWIASLMQGGGLGVYGDFLFSEYSRAGGVLETLSGPAVGEFADLTKLVSRAIRVDKYGDDTASAIGADSVKFLKQNTPFINMWMTRVAVDTAVMHLVQEPMSPGYIERYQQRLQDQQGTEMLFQ